MYFKSSDTLGIEVEANLFDDELDELPFVFDDLENEICRSQLLLELVISDNDSTDVGVFRATVDEQVFVVRLQAIESSFDSIVFRIGKKLTASIDCEGSLRQLVEKRRAT
jgi:hypothetical protein